MTASTAAPSIAFPETPERRAAIAQAIRNSTGLDEATLERVIRAFYAAARRDELIGPLFDAVEDWEHHFAKLTSFWSSVALMAGSYHGQPMAAHLKLPLESGHFSRWLELFEQTVRAECSAASADMLLDKARRIARSLELGIGAQRLTLPPRRTPV
jgi:hemoglobin